MMTWALSLVAIIAMLVGMEPLLSLQLEASIGEAFEVNWATCQQLADEGSH